MIIVLYALGVLILVALAAWIGKDDIKEAHAFHNMHKKNKETDMTESNPYKNNIQVVQNEDGDWFWRIRANNNQTLCVSETYTSKQAALKGVASMQQVVAHQTGFDIAIISFEEGQ